MKKLLSLVMIFTLSLGMLLTGCGKKDSDENAGNGAKKDFKVVFYANGSKGDKSFFDSAAAGLDEMTKKFGITTKFIEGGTDQSKWEPALEDLSNEDWNIIIVGTWQLKEPLEKIAQAHPDKKYIIFDAEVDYNKYNLKNVYSINYKQNEGGFLAGALGAKVTQSKMPHANPENVIGFVGGQDTPVINDFLVGYIQGAQYADKDVKVLTSYIGDFENTGKGKEMALAQYGNGADVVFQVAARAGLGVLDAAKSAGKYAIGVDSDQAEMFKESDPAKSELILNSVLKRVDNTLVSAVGRALDNTLPWGKAEYLGMKEDAIGICDNEVYKKNVPDDIKAYIKDIEAKMKNGEIKVDSAMGMSTDQLNQIRNSAK